MCEYVHYGKISIKGDHVKTNMLVYMVKVLKNVIIVTRAL